MRDALQLWRLGCMLVAVASWLFVTGCGARNGLIIGGADGARDGGTDTPSDWIVAEDAMDSFDVEGMDQADLTEIDVECVRGCEDGCQLFYDGFESGTGAWSLGEVWAEDVNGMEGKASLQGYWNRLGRGCPVTSAATMSTDVDLRGARGATLRFFQTGFFAEFDSLRVIVSTDGGRRWSTVASPDPLPLDAATWDEQVIDLSPWIGQPRARFGFEFDNVCGDPYGVAWYIDEVSICALVD